MAFLGFHWTRLAFTHYLVPVNERENFRVLEISSGFPPLPAADFFSYDRAMERWIISQTRGVLGHWGINLTHLQFSIWVLSWFGIESFGSNPRSPLRGSPGLFSSVQSQHSERSFNPWATYVRRSHPESILIFLSSLYFGLRWQSRYINRKLV